MGTVINSDIPHSKKIYALSEKVSGNNIGTLYIISH